MASSEYMNFPKKSTFIHIFEWDFVKTFLLLHCVVRSFFFFNRYTLWHRYNYILSFHQTKLPLFLLPFLLTLFVDLISVGHTFHNGSNYLLFSRSRGRIYLLYLKSRALRDVLELTQKRPFLLKVRFYGLKVAI